MSFTRFAIFAAVVVSTASLAACEGKIATEQRSPNQDIEDGPGPGPPPVQDRMPTVDDCEAGEEIFTNDAPARLLTRYEYDNSIRDLLGIDRGMARDIFPPENSTGGFENSVDSHRVNPLLVRKYLEVAEEIAALAVEKHSYGEGFIPGLVYRAFRRPPTTDELSGFEALYAQAKPAWGERRAKEMVVAAILQSPQFLYRIEFADAQRPNSIIKNGPFEMASRLSFMLWGTIPDETLLEAATDNELETRDQVEKQVRRMLADPRAKDLVAHFYRQWLHLDALEDVIKDGERFPDVPANAHFDWRASMDAWIQHVHFGSSGTLDELFLSPDVYMTPDLAAVYDVEVDSQMESVAMEASRSGLLTQPAFLALHAYPEQGSPIHRGIFVREQLLCQKLQPPPDDVPIEPPDPDPNATTRERFRQHTEVEGCENCHKFIDPIGFGFENYDAVGDYRTEEAGEPIDATGEMVGSGDPVLDGPFEGVLELSARLAESEVVARCIADQWTTFALGQPPTRADLCSQDGIQETFVKTGRFDELLVAIATSDAMRYRVVQEDAQ